LIRKTASFKNIPYSFIRALILILIYGIVVALSYLLPFYLFTFLYQFYYYYYYSSTTLFIINLTESLLTFLYILIILLIILETAELYSRGKVEILDPFEDYEMTYRANFIPIIGKCKLCGKAIPLFYGIKVKYRHQLLLLNDLGICFNVDEAHIKYLQEKNDNLAYNEFRFFYLKIRGWFRKYHLSHILMIVWMILSLILLSLILNSVPNLNYDYYYSYYIYPSLAEIIMILIYLIVFFLFWYILILGTFLFVKKKEMLLIKRMYLDNEDFGCFVSVMTGKSYVRLGQGKNERLPGLQAIYNEIKNRQEFKRVFFKKRWIEIKRRRRR